MDLTDVEVVEYLEVWVEGPGLPAPPPDGCGGVPPGIELLPPWPPPGGGGPPPPGSCSSS